MYVLDAKPFQAQLNAAKGELQSQQHTPCDRSGHLRTREAVGRAGRVAAFDLIARRRADAAGAVFSAKAKLDDAQLNPGYATITSPVTGLAGRSLQRQGAYVNATAESANLTYVAALDPIWVNFSISQNLMAKFKQQSDSGQVVAPKDDNFDVEIMLPGGVTYPYRGKIGFTDPSFSQDTGSFLVRAVLPNPKLDLRPGMFVTAYVKGAMRPNAIVVPQLAIQQGNNGHLVYVVNAKNVAEIRPVVVGDYYGDKDIVILAGLAAGDRVVVDGVLKVVPGQPVTVVPQGGAAPAAATPAPKATDAAKKSLNVHPFLH
jgi:membrane fusion protein (multidrug efflux system)